MRLATATLVGDDGRYPSFGYAGFKPWEERIFEESRGYDYDGMYVAGYSTIGIGDLFNKIAHKIQLVLRE